MFAPIVGMVMAAAAIGVPGWLLGWLGCCEDRPEEVCDAGALCCCCCCCWRSCWAAAAAESVVGVGVEEAGWGSEGG